MSRCNATARQLASALAGAGHALGLVLASVLASVLATAVPAGAAPLQKPVPERLVDATSGLVLESLPGRQSLALTGPGSNSPAATLNTADRALALARLLEQHFAKQTRPPQLRFAFGPYPEANDRLVAWAVCSPGWDARRGKARGQTAAAWLQAEARKSELAPELAVVWQAQGYRLTLGTVERVQLCTHAEIDWPRVAPACTQPRVDRAGRYPCGADIGFTVQQP